MGTTPDPTTWREGEQMTQDTELGDLTEIWSATPYPHHDSDRRKSRIAGRVAAGIAGAAVLAIGAYVAWTLATPLPAPRIAATAPSAPELAAVPISLAPSGGSAVIVTGNPDYLGDTSGTRLAEHDPDATFPLGGITNLITAMVILDAYPLAEGDAGPTITFSKADHDLYDQYYVKGACIAAMPTGSSLPLREALALLVVPSATNYSDAVTRWAFGSQAAYRDSARA